MSHTFTQSVNPKCIHCGLNAHHLSEVILTEPCPVADASASDDLPPLEEAPPVLEPLEEEKFDDTHGID